MAFPEHLSLREAQSLAVGDMVDFRLPNGRYVGVEITGLSRNSDYGGIFMQYASHGKFNAYRQEWHKLAAYESVSKRPAHRLLHLKRGSVVDINIKGDNRGWRKGVISKLHQNSGQVAVC